MGPGRLAVGRNDRGTGGRSAVAARARAHDASSADSNSAGAEQVRQGGEVQLAVQQLLRGRRGMMAVLRAAARPPSRRAASPRSARCAPAVPGCGRGPPSAAPSSAKSAARARAAARRDAAGRGELGDPQARQPLPRAFLASPPSSGSATASSRPVTSGRRNSGSQARLRDIALTIRSQVASRKSCRG
jgi:hypothetical protein